MDYMREYEKWLASPALTPEEHAELESIRGDEKEIRERFYGPLEFGTAGLRGTMKAGLHQMNVHVIRWATQGFANVICAEGEEAKRRGVALCMDCRNHSMEFARAAAEVCAANGIHVRIFESLRPTPELSFAVREYGCQAGINVTASHNPKEYNGYKVYWSDGAQLPPQHAAAIARELEHIDMCTGVLRMSDADAAAQGMTLFDALNALYVQYGYYGEKTHNLVMPGLDGLEKMAQLMRDLRADPPAAIAGVEVLRRKDYTDGSVIDCRTGEKSAMELSGSNVLRYELADGTTILVRPSGTEPKIKVYVLTIGETPAARDENLRKYGEWVKTLQR